MNLDFLDYVLFKVNKDIEFSVRSLILIIIGYLVAKLVAYLFRRLLKEYFKRRNVYIGRSYTIITLVKYLIYIIAFLVVINLLGIRLNYFLAGSAALLVGIGLGLQSTFNDFFSGLILLIDGTLEVGDILLIDNRYFKVKYIGLRTSRLQDIRNHLHIIPNSQLVNNKVDNLSDTKLPVRFQVKVGVAYGTDIAKVERILLEVIAPFNKFKMTYLPSVFLQEYGDSSLVFQLNFFSKEAFIIEKILSDIRKEIAKAFEREGIQIPFPQRDLWIRNEGEADFPSKK